MSTLRGGSAALVTVALLAAPALAGHWITPDWPDGKEPHFDPVPYLWFTLRECPIVYRTVVDVPKQGDRATVLLRTSGYVYVYVDGRLVYGWAPQPKTDKTPEVPADASRVHELDLSDALAPGRHVLAVSAPANGFVLDGGLYAETKRVAALATNATWTATKLPPATILDDQPVLRPDHKGDAAPVKAGEEWRTDEDALAAAHCAAAVKRLRQRMEDVAWELELLTRKGIYLHDGTAFAWGEPGRLAPSLLAEARQLLKRTGVTGWRPEMLPPMEQVEQLERRKVTTLEDAEAVWPVLGLTRRAVGRLRAETDSLAARAREADEARAMGLVARYFADPWPAMPAPRAGHLADVRAEREKQLGHLLPPLNESRYDRLGWINHPGLTDSDLSRWGIRINPVSGPTKITGPRKWLFSTDPGDKGLEERRHTIGYNIENQWPTLPTGRPWNADGRFKDYTGVAWYRARLHVPGEWAGEEVLLTVPVGGKARLWVNDKEVTEGLAGGRVRLAPEVVAYGGENFLAIRIEAGADESRRGLVGTVEASCPALDSGAAKKTPPVDVLATPLSPCAVLMPKTDVLEIHHAGKARLLIPGRGVPLIKADSYEVKGGRLPAGNWVLVWPAATTSRPILFVFERSPKRIVCEPGLTRLTFAEAGKRIIAVRPWVKQEPPSPDADAAKVLSAGAFWSRAALAVPINYMEVTRVLEPGEPYDQISVDKVPAGPVLGHTIVYDYLETKDEWGTKPLRLAPLPAFCSLAVDTKFRGLALDQKEKVEVLQDGGLLAPYRGVTGADRISYSYPVEPFPRFAGFTSWMFAGGDAGVTGNRREVEVMASTGANSFRPQHNWSDQPPPKGMFPEGDRRSRVRILADYCQAGGMNYMNNIDERLGLKPEDVTGDYPAFMEKVNRHYEKIARQVGDRPYWAVAYDLINEAFHHKHQQYNPAIRTLIKRVRAIDRRHLCYVEPCESWGAIQELALIEPTGDPLTVHSFHDYNFRLHKAEDRWPTLERDVTNIYQMWLPVFVYAIEHGVCMHCGEFGGFAGPTNSSRAQTLLMNDFFRVFDQFGMHHHYYSGREVFERLADGSLKASNVARAYRAYFARRDFNAYYTKWPGFGATAE